jgi:hypothetical protein
MSIGDNIELFRKVAQLLTLPFDTIEIEPVLSKNLGY